MKKLPISVCIISGAEAHRIGKCLASVAQWTSEIVVVLNEEVRTARRGSRHPLARKFTVTRGRDFANKRTSSLAYATCPWVLALDADEEVSEELRPSISAFSSRDQERFAGAQFARKVWFMGRWITHGDWYPDRVLRLFRRDRGNGPAARNIAPSRCVTRCTTLAGDLLHYTNPNISSYVSKINYFADLYLQRQLAEKARWSAPAAVFALSLALCARLLFPAGIAGWLSRIFHRRLDRLLHARPAQPAFRAFTTHPAAMRAAQISLIISTYERPGALEQVLARRRAANRKCPAKFSWRTTARGRDPRTHRRVAKTVGRSPAPRVATQTSAFAKRSS